MNFLFNKTTVYGFGMSCILALLMGTAHAQSIPLAQGVQNRLNVMLLHADTNFFTGFRAMDAQEWQMAGLKKEDIQDSIFGLAIADLPFSQRLLQANWLQWGDSNYTLTIDPYVDAAIGMSNEKNGYLPTGVGGFSIKGVFHHQLTFQLSTFGGMTEFPLYMNRYIDQHDGVLPGEMNVNHHEDNHLSYFHLNASVNWIPDEHITVGAGYGKLFLGDGYRSLLLSDFSGDYPYVRLKASFWKLTYNVIYSRYQNRRMVDGIRQPKYSVIHYLGANIGKRFQFGFFENTLWLGRDTDFQRGFDVQYLNPLILMRPVEFSLGSTDNAMMGFTGKYTFKNGYIYGQLGLDDINFGQTFKHKKQHLNNKYFFQVGVWTHNLLGLKNLDWRVEWNGVRPYTYGHRKPDQNYTHNYQPLTDPFQANFHEFISLFNYSKARWYGSLENLLTFRGENPGLPYNNGEDLWGGEDNVPKLGSKTLQGDVYRYWYHQLSVGYLLNPKNRLSLQADFFYRSRSGNNQNQSETGFFIGIRTNLFNHYKDF